MEVPRHWRLQKQRYGLVGEICPHCEAKLFPIKEVCPECNNTGIKLEKESPSTSNSKNPFVASVVMSLGSITEDV